MVEPGTDLKNRTPGDPDLRSDWRAQQDQRELTILRSTKISITNWISRDLRGFGAYTISEHLVLEHVDLKATNTADNPDHVKPHNNGDAAVQGTTVKASLPKLSRNVIRLTAK